MDKLAAISEFQCSGCVCGGPTTNDCDRFKIHEDNGYVRCLSHVVGMSVMTNSGLTNFALGLPNGFNRCGVSIDGNGYEESVNTMIIRIWLGGMCPQWNHLNVPVWAMEKDGFLFVRTYLPRKNQGIVDVIQDGKIEELCPDAIDVAKFYNEID